MKATLWIDITIAGAIYLVGALLWGLALSSTPDEVVRSFFHESKDYLPYVSVAFGATAYIVGVLAHRTLQLLPGFLLRRFTTLLRVKQKYEPGQRAQVVRIWQYGSDRLHRELDFQYSLVALLRSLLVSLPILGTGLAATLYASEKSGVIITLITTALVWLVCLIAFRRQWNNYVDTEQAATAALETIEQRALVAGSSISRDREQSRNARLHE